MTGDGIRDVITGAPEADVLRVADSGAGFVFAGAANLAGIRYPLATLRDSQASADDELGRTSGGGASLQLADLDDGGELDVLLVAARSDRDAVDAGRLHAWRGGAPFAGGNADIEVHRASPLLGDLLAGASGQVVRFADVTGDGVLELVVSARAADVGGVFDSGGVFVRPGPLAPDSVLLELATPSAVANDRITAE